MKKLLIILILIFIPLIVYAKEPKKHQYYEKDYQAAWCGYNKGQTEYKLPDKARVDCITNDYAIEFDFANKWAEAIGQSLYYAMVSDKKPGIVLIIENKQKDEKFLKRIKTVTEKNGITLWTITPEDLKILK